MFCPGVPLEPLCYHHWPKFRGKRVSRAGREKGLNFTVFWKKEYLFIMAMSVFWVRFWKIASEVQHDWFWSACVYNPSDIHNTSVCTGKVIVVHMCVKGPEGYSNYFSTECAVRGPKPLPMSKDFSHSKNGWLDSFSIFFCKLRPISKGFSASKTNDFTFFSQFSWNGTFL